MKRYLTASLYLVCLCIHAQGLSPTQLRALKADLASCSGNFLFMAGATKSRLITLDSEFNNDKAVNFLGIMNTFYAEIGKSIDGGDYESIAKEFYDSRVKKFNTEKATLGVLLAKQNLMTNTLGKFDYCINLLNEPKNVAYVSTIFNSEQIKILRTYIEKNSIRSR